MSSRSRSRSRFHGVRRENAAALNTCAAGDLVAKGFLNLQRSASFQE
jgi:hypothetical protein